MRITVVLCSILVVLAPVAPRADVLTSEPHAMIYFEIPFGANRHDAGSGFGLRLDRVDMVRSHGVHLAVPDLHPEVPLFDFKAGAAGIQRLTIGGMNYLPLIYINKADDKGKDESASKPDEDKLTFKKILHDTPVGYLMGAVLGVVILTGVSH